MSTKRYSLDTLAKIAGTFPGWFVDELFPGTLQPGDWLWAADNASARLDISVTVRDVKRAADYACEIGLL